MPNVRRGFFLEQAEDELFDHRLYLALAERAPDEATRGLLRHLADHEKRHLEFWARLAGVEPDDVAASRARLSAALLLARGLGVAFTIRRLERREAKTIARYNQIADSGLLNTGDRNELRRIIDEEESHEKEIESQVTDERVAYLGAAVLGLNDALVELTGGLTGLVSSITDARLIGFTGAVIGTAAALSMAASNFLSAGMTPPEKQAEGFRPIKAAAYTGSAYILVVVGLVAPFFLLENRVAALSATWLMALAVIVGFAYYSAVLQDLSFSKRVAQMLALGLGVAIVTFTIGRLISQWFGISV